MAELEVAMRRRRAAEVDDLRLVVHWADLHADQEAHRARLLEERHRRFVSATRTDEAGLRTVIARVSAGDPFRERQCLT